MDSPPSDPVGFTRKRHHTPHTVPRTRLPPGTPMPERLAMESLRQQLSFEEEAEVCILVNGKSGYISIACTGLSKVADYLQKSPATS